MSDDDHRRLLELICRSKARIILSGYRCELYDKALCEWHKDTIESQTTSTEKATETLWQNFEPPMEQLTFNPPA